MLENKYTDMVPLLRNSCDTRLSTRLVPTIPTNTEVDGLLSEILMKRGIVYRSIVDGV